MRERSLIIRVLIGLVLVAAVLALVFWAPLWLFFLGLLPFGLLGLWEYLELMGRVGVAPARLPVYLVALAIWVAAAFRPVHWVPALLLGSLLLFAFSARTRSLTEIPATSAASVFGLFYLAVPFALVFQVWAAPDGKWVLIYLLALVWIGDTAAYFGGRALGRHKLAPVLSPGKTVEGTVISALVTVGLGFWLFRAWFDPLGSSFWHGLLLPLVVNGAAQVGDLAESALKRAAGVKDSSAIIPGHGGVLDRIDALLFALPALWYYWLLLLRGGF
ncbi:MAG: phosphatidate cytidylyltransferase [Candidatus Acidiferrales bacterium]